MPAARLLAATLLALTACSNPSRPAKPEKTEAESEPETTREPAKTRELRVAGFSTPESVLWDPATDLYLVSNISGDPTGVDDDGFISKVKPDGTIETLRWIDGKRDDVELSAPKGSCLVGDLLLVTDITHVRRFDRNTGAAKGSIAIPDAQFLNDLACDRSGAWVSDFMAGKIHRIADATADASSLALAAKGVNGLAIDADGWLWAVADGHLFRVVEGVAKDDQVMPANGLDGIVVLPKGELLISSWDAAAILRGKPGGVFEPLFEELESPADIGFDAERKRLLIPLFQGNEVVLRDLP
ncbi:SMP-30/gluconolactonase/LRE family protein [Nannocystaceae bacterium ST9]